MNFCDNPVHWRQEKVYFYPYFPLFLCVCSPDGHQALGDRPSGFPNHHDEDWSHQTLPVHRLPPQVQLTHMLPTSPFLALTTWEWLTSLALNSPPSVPSFQSLTEDILSKLADVLEEVTIFYKQILILALAHRLTVSVSAICSPSLTNTNLWKHSVQ